LWLIVRRMLGRPEDEARLCAADAPWLAGAILFGGVAGPILLMLGQQSASAATASLLLNLEAVLTAAIAWVVFRENADRRMVLGMVAIVAGGVLLAWEPHAARSATLGSTAVAGACLCWAIDNNLTRRVSGRDPVSIAALKGLVAGAVNIGIAISAGQLFPPRLTVLGAGVVGLAGYGVSLVLFVLALRHLGTARTGAYFSTAPFVGASLSLILWSQELSPIFLTAAGLMALGVWFHISERHEHEHVHEALMHEHRHSHDEHHQHDHDAGWDGAEPHTHKHWHEPLHHAHPHYPDIHHRHRH
jgi:drug/metabolite transporter (DMT)-like permease